MTAEPAAQLSMLEDRSEEMSATKMNHWLLECLDSVVGMFRSHGDLTGNADTADVCASAAATLRRVVDFEAVGFWMADTDTFEFHPVYLEPEAGADSLVQELENHIESGTFAWSTKQNRPVIVPATLVAVAVMVLSPGVSQTKPAASLEPLLVCVTGA